VREVADDAGTPDLADSAELAVSEVVTNGILHAHTDMTVVVVAYPEHLCVEVHDGNAALPVARHYRDEASTGRGLGLVSSVAVDCGVHQLPEGKVVWFCVSDDADERSADELLAAWDLDEIEEAATQQPSVVLRSMPVHLWMSAREHHDALLRELALFAVEHDLEVDLARADAARSRISEAVAKVAAATSEAAVDLGLLVEPEDVPAFLSLPDTLDLAERLAVRGDLLANPALPEIIAVRDWACEQVVAQLAGIPAVPWPGTDQERFETEVHGRAAPAAFDVAEVQQASTPVIAADDANRIIAVSEPLAHRLGWSQEDLLGRRVVTIVPPALREAHVAGFTRHLSTGVRRLLDQTVELPVLAADDSEVPCRIRIEVRPGGAGRSVFVAWVEPLAADDR
jgi:PAS domain S-box-containing protein